MDILIKNVKMPRGNNVLVVDSAGTITKVNRWTGKVEATDPFSVKAVALPEHGRLCDLDYLIEHETYNIEQALFDTDEVLEDLKNTPVIVEANYGIDS